MPKENFSQKNFFAAIGVAAVCVLVLAGLFLPFPSVFSATAPDGTNTGDDKDEMRTVSVSGMSEISVAPEKVELYVSVVTESLKAKDSQAQNASAFQKVSAALLAAGVKKENIETVSYSLNEISEYDNLSQKYVKKGYRAVNAIKITVTSIADAGKIIDVATAAGANEVNNIVFGLTKKTEDELKLQALQNASADSLNKAKIMAKGVNVKIKQLESMTENSNVYIPYYAKAYDLRAEAAGAPAPSTEFFAGSIKVSASVQATYSIE